MTGRLELTGSQKTGKNLIEMIKTIAVNILLIPHNAKTIGAAYRSKYNNKRKKQGILLMITDGKKWHYLAITNLSALLQLKSSNHYEDFHCFNCFTTKNKIKEHGEICNNHDSTSRKAQLGWKSLNLKSWKKNH